jgi:mRNA interferase HicA
MNSNEFKRWLAKQGATLEHGQGSHIEVFLNGGQSVLPMHATALKTGKVEVIQTQLGVKAIRSRVSTGQKVSQSLLQFLQAHVVRVESATEQHGLQAAFQTRYQVEMVGFNEIDCFIPEDA